MLVEYRGTTMGTQVHLAAVGLGEPHLARALEQLHDWDRRWTRFSTDSELAAINRAEGRPCVVGRDTAALVAAAIDGWRTTDGRFDPTVHDAMVAAGYDRTFAAGPGPGADPAPTPGPQDVQVDVEAGVVILPADVRLDLGGIGKGFAADRLARDLLDQGATSAAVTIGGDTRIVGETDHGWPIAAEGWDEPIAQLIDGGFCFSSTARRRWRIGVRDHHHIVDPRTGTSTTSGIRHVAVAAADATTAEVQATAAVVAGWPAAPRILEQAGLDGFVVTDDGTAHRFGGWPANPSIFGRLADGSRCE